MEPQSRAIAIPVENVRIRLVGVFTGFSQPVASAMERAAGWAGETAQNFGALVSALMGPAVLCAYAIALWSLSAGFGWTDSFLFTSGALSNWMVWLAVAILIHVAASVLRRRIEE